MKKYERVSFSQISVNGGFWAKRQKINTEKTIFSVRDRFMETGRFDAFKFEWNEDREDIPQPHIFWDSDIAKWIESAAYIIQKNKGSDEALRLEKQIDETVGLIIKNQAADGYFNTYFQLVEPKNRFKNRDAHELYCAGHLMEAAVAYYNATGKNALLKAMCKYADYIEKVFKIETSADFKTPGHEEIELALVKLYRATGEKRYLELSGHFIDKRGLSEEEPKTRWCNGMYNQSHLPVREQKTAEGHAVRACYLYSGMADIAREHGDAELFLACKTIFNNIVDRRMYISGGIGSSSSGEAFTVDYDLPNSVAYAETCAAIALAMFAGRMSLIEPLSVYADTVERVLYNGFLSGISLDGTSFFYENPLEITKAEKNRNVAIRKINEHFPLTRRQEVFDCSCCPPNVTRLIASIADYMYSYSDSTVFVHQYICSGANFTIGKREIEIIQETAYPYEGKVSFKVKNARGFEIALRIPYWCKKFDTKGINNAKTLDGYMYFDITDDYAEISIDFELEAALVRAHPSVIANAGKSALMYGPFVYCMESTDNQENLKGLYVNAPLKYETVYDSALDCPVIIADGARLDENSFDGLYNRRAPVFIPQKLKFIPYHAFANREDCDMLIWFNTIPGIKD